MALKTKKVLILGVDGASFDLIELGIKKGLLPAFKKIMENGAACRLKSTIPPLTPCAWSSLITGKNPGKHGIYDFYYLDSNYNMKLNSSKTRKCLDLWDYLGQNGEKSFVFYVPFTYPPKKINGIMVTDFTTPSLELDFTYPPDLKDVIIKKYPNFKLWEETKYSKRKEDIRKYAKELFDIADIQFKVSVDLLKKESFDFKMIVFMLVDHAQHYYWKYMDKSHPEYSNEPEFENIIMNAYEKIDGFLDYYIELFPDHNIIIVSDHGSGPFYKDVSINKWLKDEGYLFLKEKRSYLKKTSDKIGIDKLIKSGLNIGLWNVINKFPYIKSYITKKFFTTLQDIDWSRTIAYSYGSYGNIFLNDHLLANERDKIKLINEIRIKLNNLLEPNSNQPLIRNFWVKKELYKGNNLDKFPDIILNMGDFSYAASTTFSFFSNKIFSEPKTFKSGDHSMYGVFMAFGPDINKGLDLKGAEICDVTPTILHMFGIPVPEDMDGRILNEIIKNDEELSNTKIEYQTEESFKNITKLHIKRLKNNRKL